MEQFSFVFMIFFILLGPLKIIPAFGAVTQGADESFKRAVAIRGALIASAVVAFVALAGETLLGRYRISVDGLRIAGGLVLLLAALKIIFSKAPPLPAGRIHVAPIQLAVSPLAAPAGAGPHAGGDIGGHHHFRCREGDRPCHVR